jgi:hypothetical protein
MSSNFISNSMILFGLFWTAVNSIVFGLRLGFDHEKHVDTLKRLMEQRKLEEFENCRSQWEWRKAVHGHSILLSLIAIVMGMLVPMMTSSSLLYINIMGVLLVLPPILWSFFGTWFFKPLLGLGDFFFVIGIIMGCISYGKITF